MKILDRNLKSHFFVCMNERAENDPRGSCKAKGAEQILKCLKEAIAKRGLSKEMRAQKAGCLDVCEHGPAVVRYPDAKWFTQVDPAKDIDSLFLD